VTVSDNIYPLVHKNIKHHSKRSYMNIV